LFLDVGLGKSSVTLAAFKLLRKAGAVHRALIVAPLRVAENVWSASGEVGRWADFADLKVALLHGPHKEDVLDSGAPLVVINYEGLSWLVQEKRIDKLLKSGVDMIIFDELSKMKNGRTQRMKALKPYLGRFKRRLGLTGSPAANGLLDLFSEVYALDLGARLGPYLTHYRNTYFTPCGFQGYDWPAGRCDFAFR